jgi:hypothetical protein
MVPALTKPPASNLQLPGRDFSRQALSNRVQSLLSVLWAICLVGVLSFTQPVQAEQWTLVVTSDDGYQQQYVDVESMQLNSGNVRLKTYWLDLHQPDVVTHAVTEYDCDCHLFRDIELNGTPHQTEWFDLGDDFLNRAVMNYSCPKLKQSG